MQLATICYPEGNRPNHLICVVVALRLKFLTRSTNRTAMSRNFRRKLRRGCDEVKQIFSSYAVESSRRNNSCLCVVGAAGDGQQGDKTHCVRSTGTSVSHDAADWGLMGTLRGELRALAGLLIVISQRLICVVLRFLRNLRRDIGYIMCKHTLCFTYETQRHSAF